MYKGNLYRREKDSWTGKLYFIAVIPQKELCDRILEIKREFSTRFSARHALKSPAHITLQQPFRREESFEKRMMQSLNAFAGRHSPFTANLQGFGAFAPSVIYVDVTGKDQFRELHNDLRTVLSGEMEFADDEIMRGITPHITVAHRDLRKELFHEAWESFRNREFAGKFEARGVSLLKHNGTNWDIYKEFVFDKTPQ